MCLPGRESRFVEPCYTSWTDLVQDFSKDVHEFLKEKPFAFWGHRSIFNLIIKSTLIICCTGINICAIIFCRYAVLIEYLSQSSEWLFWILYISQIGHLWNYKALKLVRLVHIEFSQLANIVSLNWQHTGKKGMNNLKISSVLVSTISHNMRQLYELCYC